MALKTIKKGILPIIGSIIGTKMINQEQAYSKITPSKLVWMRICEILPIIGSIIQCTDHQI